MKYLKKFENFSLNESLKYSDATVITLEELTKMLDDNSFVFPDVPYMGHAPESKPQWMYDNFDTDEAHVEMHPNGDNTIIVKEPDNTLYFYVNKKLYRVNNVSEPEYDNIIRNYLVPHMDESVQDDTENVDLTKNKSNSDGLGYAYDELVKIKDAIDNGRLKLVEGEKGWRKYIISVTFLNWSRNLEDGYDLDVYGLGKTGHRIHIGNIKNGRITTHCDNFSFQRYVLKKDIKDIKFEE